MKEVACMLGILALAVAWDPVRPGALVKQVGDMIIVDQSVRVILKFDNINAVRENVKQINQGIQLVKEKMVINKVSDVRLEKKLKTIQSKVTKVENNFLQSKAKRGLGIAVAVGTLVGLGTTGIGLYADLYSRVNNIENSVSRIDTLQEETEDIQVTINDMINNIEQINIDNSNVRDSLEIFMALDQLYIKINEVDTGMEQLIQDLVMANAGHVTSTLFSITQLLNITQQAKNEWNFQPFFDETNIALYYPILSSFVNNTGVIIDIPFSSELKYHIYNLIPFPMKLNGSIVTVDTDITSPVNYILSIDGLKESVIVNDDLFNCKRTNVNLYLCSATYFTFNEALSHSCAASLVKNLSVSSNCHFKEVVTNPRHETVQESHYFYFPNRTTVSIVCPNLQPQVASLEGLYRVPDQCELYSPSLTTVANRKKKVVLNKEHILQDISLTFSARTPQLKIRRVNKNRSITHVQQTHTNILWWIVPFVTVTALLIIPILILHKKFKRLTNPRVRHVSAP